MSQGEDRSGVTRVGLLIGEAHANTNKKDGQHKKEGMLILRRAGKLDNEESIFLVRVIQVPLHRRDQQHYTWY